MLSDHAAQNLRTSSIGLSIWALLLGRRRCCGKVDAVDRGIRVLAEVFHPRSLDAGIVDGRLDEAQEVGNGRVEAPLQLRVADTAGFVEGPMRLCEGEHVGIHASAEVLERNAQCPETAIATCHRRRGREQQAVALVEGLWSVAR